MTTGFFHPMKKGKVMKKRILSAVVVLVLFAGVLAGCISGNGTQDAKLNIIDDNYRNYYEIFVGSFYDSDGDGMGDLKGVEEKLDYISDLGCNGIWLMPIMPSPTYHKYDTTDYEAVDEAYGTADDFKELASACHEKGIRLIIDVAMNRNQAGKLCGDVDYPAVKEIVSAITPVPGGVGKMTIVELLENTVEAAEKQTAR